MTTTVTETARDNLANPLASLPTALGLIIIVLLISLLVEKEIFRAQGRRWPRIARVLDTTIVPLSLVAAYVIVVRMLQIMGEL